MSKNRLPKPTTPKTGKATRQYLQPIVENKLRPRMKVSVRTGAPQATFGLVVSVKGTIVKVRDVMTDTIFEAEAKNVSPAQFKYGKF